MASHYHSGRFPVVDIFAGPGGLGEGFEALRPVSSCPGFQIALSIECDDWAHRTLELRTFFRQFTRRAVPEDYYRYLRGEISRAELFAAYPKQAEAAASIARKAILGEEPARNIDKWISDSLKTPRSNRRSGGDWILVGGPPCQAYSLVGRARRTRETREQFESDKRHYLYREYLRILERHKPAVFVMENVKGLLSASLGGERIFGKICDDLAGAGYELHSLTGGPCRDLSSSWLPSSFVVRSELHGIPQSRHRVFIIGVRKGRAGALKSLSECEQKASVHEAISDLPQLRSVLSGRNGGNGNWEKSRDSGIRAAGGKLAPHDVELSSGAPFVRHRRAPKFERDWFHDERLKGATNHEARGHIPEDIARYAFVSTFALSEGRSPTLSEFPRRLLPKHRNVRNGQNEMPFADRFRVQVANKPACTVTSHIAKDGHYYIHPDPMQARSLTVREAARLQTFPDNYFFEGPRTEQYRQVGNAVPPLLAKQIAEIVADCLR
jgi:DNA (cytosine-5)-methyltransferase 1